MQKVRKKEICDVESHNYVYGICVIINVCDVENKEWEKEIKKKICDIESHNYICDICVM